MIPPAAADDPPPVPSSTGDLDPATLLFREVELRHPDVYRRILFEIRPHTVPAVIRVLRHHLAASVPDLEVFERHRHSVPDFLLRFVRTVRARFPTPGDAFGIQLTCRVTKTDTQGTLDSKHLKNDSATPGCYFNVDKSVLFEIFLFSAQNQLLELSNRRLYATVYVRDTSVAELLVRLPYAVALERGLPLNKGRCADGRLHYLHPFQYILVPDPKGHLKILYRSSRDLEVLLRHLDARRVLALSDIRFVFKYCGILAHYLNLRRIVALQATVVPGSVHEKDVHTLLKYQCRTGRPLPLNRDGLAKNPERSPLEVLSFEAPKKNLVRYVTSDAPTRQRVIASTDKIFFGEQFNEGTGHVFSVVLE